MKKPKTIADRIRKMTDEELTSFLWKIECQEIDYGITFCEACDEKYDCPTRLKVWLSRDYDPTDLWSKGIASEEEKVEVW